MKRPGLPSIDSPTEERLNAQFREEAERFGLVYKCRDCVHCNLITMKCTYGFPNEMLLGDDVRGLWDGGQFVFCKDFELEG